MTGAAKNEYQKKYAAELRAAGSCIQSRNHGRAYKGGRCYACWQKKLDNDALRYQRAKRRRHRR